MKMLSDSSRAFLCGMILALLVLCAGAAEAATFYVDSGRPDDLGDGLTWGTAKKTVQAAITAAPGAPDQVWVKKGTYTESITMKTGVSVYGGFAGTETLLTQRNAAGNVTTLDATTASPRFHVVIMDSIINARIDGFTIQGGQANAAALPDNSGGGIYCNNLNNTNTIAACQIKTNLAIADGSGIYCGAASAPAITGCVISGNGGGTASRGGGLFCDASSPAVSNCVFLSNVVAANTAGGAGVGLNNSLATFNTCVLTANQALKIGGGVWAQASTPAFSNCYFIGNSAVAVASAAGGIYLVTSPATFTNCIVCGNWSGTVSGGGVYCNASAPAFTNCTISSNSTTGNGGGIFCNVTSKPVLKNTIFENNTKYAIYENDAGSDPVVTYCLFFNNPNGDYYDNDTASSLTIAALNLIAGNGNNVGTDPKFTMNGATAITGTWTAAGVYAGGITTLTNGAAAYTPGALAGRFLNADTTQQKQTYVVTNTATQIYVMGDASAYANLGDTYRVVDYHLGYGSGAIDYATNAGAPATDLDGNARPMDIPGIGGAGLTYDIGVYEVALIAYADVARPDDTGDGLSWATAKKTIQAAISLSANAHPVWVKRGTYPEAITVATGVSVYGGFAGTETAFSQRNLAANATVINAAPSAVHFHAVTMDSITNARVDGFTITGGNANGGGVNALGGGIYANNLNNTNTLANCTVIANVAGAGGGIYCGAASSPAISNCTFTVNVSASLGTICCNAGSNPTLTSCLLANNLATGANAIGAGLCCSTSSPILNNCVIVQNSSLSTNYGGGGVACLTSSPVFTNCYISGNSTNRNGGGLLCLTTSAPALTNCLISGNSALNGGSLYCDASAPVLLNCTVGSGAASGNGGGVFCLNGSNPNLKNTSFENATMQAIYEGDGSSDPIITNCLFNSNPDGDYFDEAATMLTGAAAINALPGNSGNVDGDPKFVMNGPAGITGTWTAAPVYSSTTLQTTLTNAAAAYTPNAFTGRLINANMGQRLQAMIAGNNATQIFVIGNVTSYVANGNSYKVIDYHLSDLSAAVDTGAAGGPATDLEAKPRPVDIVLQGANGTGTEFDIGAYEAQVFAPAVRSIVRVGSSPTNAASVDFTVTFSKPVTGVDSTDFTVTASGVLGASVTGVSADAGVTRTVTVNTGSNDGTLRLDVVDNDTIIDNVSNPLGGAGAGNGNFTTGDVYTIDKTAPQADVITPITPSPTNAGIVSFSVHFTEPVLNFNDVSDLAIVRTGTVAYTDATIIGSGDSYTVDVNGFTGDGSITLAASTTSDVQDAATNPLASSVTSVPVVVDHTIPAGAPASIADVGAAQAGATAYTFTVLYQDNVAIDVGSLGDTDVRVTGPGGFDQLAVFVSVDVPGNGTPRTATYQITPPGGLWDAADTGTYSVGLEFSQVLDTSGNPAAPTSLGTFTVDLMPPTATLSSAPNVGSTQAGQTSYQFTVDYDDNLAIDVASLGDLDIEITGPSGYAQFAVFMFSAPPGTGTPRTATYQITPPGGSWDVADTGNYVIHAAAGEIRDTFGNAVAAGVLGSFDVNVARPTVALGNSPDVGAGSAGQTLYTFTVAYQDATAINVGSLDNADIRVTGPNGFNQLAAFVIVAPSGNGTPRTATYQITPPGGAWDAADTGAYSISVEGNQVFNTSGNPALADTLGTFNVDVVAPTAQQLNASNVNTLSPPATYTFEIIYADNAAIAAASLDSTDVRVTGPNGYDALAEFLFLNPTGDGSPRTATYQITPSGGAWSPSADGDYTIAVEPNQVFDLVNNPVAAGVQGTFHVDMIPPTAALTLIDATPTSADAVTFHVDFSESVGSSFTAAEVSVSLGSLAGAIDVSGAGPNYTVTVTLADPDADGPLGISVSGTEVTDLAGNPYAGGDSPVYTIHNWHGFSTEPSDTRLYTSDSHTFRVDADFGPITPAFQWKWEDVSLVVHDGPASQTWDIMGATSASRGHYWCEVTYDGVVHESAHALLSVQDHLQITTPLVDGSANFGGPFMFTVGASGGYAPLAYVWKKNGGTIFGATGSSYTIASVLDSDAGTYTVDVSDSYMDVQTDSAALSLNVQNLPVAGIAGVALLLALLGTAGVSKTRKK